MVHLRLACLAMNEWVLNAWVVLDEPVLAQLEVEVLEGSRKQAQGIRLKEEGPGKKAPTSSGASLVELLTCG